MRSAMSRTLLGVVVAPVSSGSCYWECLSHPKGVLGPGDVSTQRKLMFPTLSSGEQLVWQVCAEAERLLRH